MLFTPASVPRRFTPAYNSGAGIRRGDLEDSISVGNEHLARRQAAMSLEPPKGRPHGRGVRINALTEADGLCDLSAFPEYGTGPDIVVVPKAGMPRDTELVCRISAVRSCCVKSAC
jgi:citrate lyase subunit beta/citryl-CoA lyase/(S)-citramalyl-CoA lyase